MSEVAHATPAQEVKSEGMQGKENTGTLQGPSKEYSVLPYADTADASKSALAFLTEANEQPRGGDLLFEAVLITPELAALEQEISNLLNMLAALPTQEKALSKETESAVLKATSEANRNSKKEGKTSSGESGNQALNTVRSGTVFTSLFSLARSMHQNQKSKQSDSSKASIEKGLDSLRSAQAKSPLLPSPFADLSRFDNNKSYEFRNQEQEREHDDQQERGSGQGQHDARDQQQQEQKNKEKKKLTVQKVSATRGASKAGGSKGKTDENLEGVESLYIRFMALMARILGQAEAEAHELYQRIKSRTDDVDTLTLLISKINSANGKIDWSKDEEMKKLVERAREIGVDIPENKFTWSDDEKKLLKENIQMRKDSMEKITQLERTDMQRYLQEASQCHQARSNVLKLLKEVMDTIVHNMRP